MTGKVLFHDEFETEFKELPPEVQDGVATANDFVGEVNKRKIFAITFRE